MVRITHYVLRSLLINDICYLIIVLCRGFGNSYRMYCYLLILKKYIYDPAAYRKQVVFKKTLFFYKNLIVTQNQWKYFISHLCMKLLTIIDIFQLFLYNGNVILIFSRLYHQFRRMEKWRLPFVPWKSDEFQNCFGIARKWYILVLLMTNCKIKSLVKFTFSTSTFTKSLSNLQLCNFSIFVIWRYLLNC